MAFYVHAYFLRGVCLCAAFEGSRRAHPLLPDRKNSLPVPAWRSDRCRGVHSFALPRTLPDEAHLQTIQRRRHVSAAMQWSLRRPLSARSARMLRASVSS